MARDFKTAPTVNGLPIATNDDLDGLWDAHLQAVDPHYGKYAPANLTAACRMHQTTASAVPHRTWTHVPLQAVSYDHRPAGVPAQASTSAGLIYVRVTGWYRIDAQLSFDSNGTGRRFAAITTGANGRIAAQGTGAIESHRSAISVETFMAEGETVRLFAYQDQGVTVNTSQTTVEYIDYNSWLAVRYLTPGSSFTVS